MKKLTLLILVALLAPLAVNAQNTKKGAKVVSPFVEGKQKVRKSDYDSIWKFTTFDGKKIYFCDFDYSTIPALIDERHPDWGNFTPVMNYLTTVARSPMRICAVFAVNPTVEDDALREKLIEQGREEALEALKTYQAWAAA